MRCRLVRKCLPIVCLLASSFYTGLVLADWYGEESQQYYSQKFGSFPPLDIDKQLDEGMKTDNQLEQGQLEQDQSQNISQPQNIGAINPDKSLQQSSYPTQEYAVQKPPQTNYPGTNYPNTSNLNNYEQESAVSSRSVKPQNKRHRKPKKKRESGFSDPWSSRGSGFSAPWDNSSSSFSGPWNNRGSGFSGPWDNSDSGFSFPWGDNGSGFSTPWDGGNGSGFSAPWNNSGSSFGPWGNRRHR